MNLFEMNLSGGYKSKFSRSIIKGECYENWSMSEKNEILEIEFQG